MFCNELWNILLCAWVVCSEFVHGAALWWKLYSVYTRMFVFGSCLLMRLPYRGWWHKHLFMEATLRTRWFVVLSQTQPSLLAPLLRPLTTPLFHYLYWDNPSSEVHQFLQNLIIPMVRPSLLQFTCCFAVPHSCTSRCYLPQFTSACFWFAVLCLLCLPDKQLHLNAQKHAFVRKS